MAIASQWVGHCSMGFWVCVYDTSDTITSAQASSVRGATLGQLGKYIQIMDVDLALGMP